MATNEDCIFCRILRGEIPCAKVFEDDACLAFLDIGPIAKGHCLLIPKDHYQTLAEMPAETAAAVLRRLPALVAAVQQVSGCEGTNVLQNNGRVAGQVVEHVHFHVIPRNTGDAMQIPWPAGSYAEGELAPLAEAVAQAVQAHLK